jgi:hypothetical protein
LSVGGEPKANPNIPGGSPGRGVLEGGDVGHRYAQLQPTKFQPQESAGKVKGNGSVSIKFSKHCIVVGSEVNLIHVRDSKKK